MGKRRRMMKKNKYDEAYKKQTIQGWSDLNHDVLSLVMMKLGVFDFLAFSRVCKSWRSLAISNKNEFIVSKPPMSISISIRANKKSSYYLKDFEGRKIKIRLPHSAKRRCIGVTCGYVILLGEKTSDIWLVNLITRHELHFPNVPGDFFCCPGQAKAILVYSPSMSGWVFVMFNTCYNDKIWFSLEGEQKWTCVSSCFSINDITAFKGKIYTLLYQMRLCEMKLYLKDFEGRKIKIRLPHSAKRRCIGVTCGYVILLGEKTSDIWLVNLITRHELHFPNVPGDFFCCPGQAKAILVYSPSMSGWVFVMFNTCYNDKIWFSLEGEQKWTCVSSCFSINDITAFKGKIYTLLYQMRLCEMKLYLEPELVLLETASFPKPNFICPKFVSCGENLYVIELEQDSKHPYKIHEIDLDEMKWVSRKKTGQQYSFFRSNSKYVYYKELYDGRYVVANRSGKGRTFYASLWYFFFDCLNVDIIHE